MTAWSPAKVSAFRDGFYDFLDHVIISSKDGRVRLGQSLYRAQTMFYDTVFDGLAEDVHEFLILKSRQLGISTGTRALDLFWLGMHEGIRGSLVFDSAFNTAAARREIVETLKNLPKRLHFPGIKSDSRDALVLENDSHLMFRQAGTKNSRTGGGLGRSLGLNLSHGSEISSWASEEGVKSYTQSLSETYENRLYIWESTGRGYELWYRMWCDAKDDPYTKKTLFLGWWSKDNQIIPRTDARFSVYASEPPNKRENERMDVVEASYGWKITPEQLAWIRWKTDPGRELDEDDPEDGIAIQEQAWVEEDAFQQSGSAFFMADKLTAASARLIDEVKPQVFKFWPGQNFVESNMEIAKTHREIEFKMWEEPVSDSVYIVAADPAFGHDENNDRSAVQVLRCYADAVDQVGEYASATIHPHHFAWLLWTLIGYYGSTKTGCQVYFICEINGPGEEVWRQFQSTEQIVRNGYLRTAAREKGIADIFQNARKYIYTRSDAMSAGQSWQWKCLSLDTLLPTPTGWEAIANIKPGDEVFDERGRICIVQGTSGIEHDHECYRITFDDRTSIVCDKQHRWKTSDGFVRTTDELRAGSHKIWVTEPLELPEADLPIDPYVLGLWLGDGSSSNSIIYGHRDDMEEVARYIQAAGYEISPLVSDGHEDGNVLRVGIITMYTQLRVAELLGNKHIPRSYLRASKEQRLELLRGLMDTDGSITPASRGQCTFYTSSPEIASGFSELLRSLGIKAKYLTKIPQYEHNGEKRTGKLAYQFAFTGYDDMPVFRLRRKLDILMARFGRSGKAKERRHVGRTHKIVSVEPMPSVPVKCIAVDSPSHLFLAGEAMIPTHNTHEQNKVQIMEACRNYFHNGAFYVRSMDLLEEMRTITRDGDSIGAEDRNKDDRVFSAALGIRAWDERARRPLIAGNRTKEAERAKRSLTIDDQWTIFQRNKLTDFFAVKERARRQQQMAALREGWRTGTGARRPQAGRRW